MSTPSSVAVNWANHQKRAFLSGLAPSLVLLAAITIVPTLALLVVSLTPFSLTNPAATFRFDDPLVNYRQLLHDARFIESVVIQLKLSAVSVVLQLAIGLAIALLLNGKSKWLAGLRTAFLIPMVLPPIVTALIWKILYTPDISPIHQALDSLGWPLGSLIANPATALWAIAAADTWQWFPFTMLMVLAALQTIPDDPLEAATLDGAGPWQLFRYIVFPYLQPVLVICGLFRLIDTFKAFPLIYVLTDGGPGTVTQVTNYYSFVEAFNFSYWGYASAIATVVLAGVFALSVVIGKFGRSRDDVAW